MIGVSLAPLKQLFFFLQELCYLYQNVTNFVLFFLFFWNTHEYSWIRAYVSCKCWIKFNLKWDNIGLSIKWRNAFKFLKANKTAAAAALSLCHCTRALFHGIRTKLFVSVRTDYTHPCSATAILVLLIFTAANCKDKIAPNSWPNKDRLRCRRVRARAYVYLCSSHCVHRELGGGGGGEGRT